MDEAPRTRGRLVVVDGPDCAGKTTAARRLEREHGFLYVKRPDRSSPTGKVLNAFLKREIAFSSDKILNERAAQLIFAANNLEGCREIVEALEAGRDVVMDRGIPSAVVYHSAAVGTDAREFILAINRGVPAPDLVVVFEVAPEVAASRRATFGDERNDSIEVQRAVGEGFRRFFPDATFIDASRTADEVFADLVAHVEACRAVGGVAFY